MGVTFCVAPTFLFGGFRPAGRGERRVLSSDGKNQRSPGDGSDERLRGAGAHSHLSPGPPVTGAGPFGLLLPSGGLNFDCAPLYSRATGPSSSQSPLYSGCPCLGVRNKADFATTMPAGRDCPRNQEGIPRKRGPGQAAYERPLREGAHRRRPRRFFGDFLIAQKVTPPSRPAGRNPPNKKTGATQIG